HHAARGRTARLAAARPVSRRDRPSARPPDRGGGLPAPGQLSFLHAVPPPAPEEVRCRSALPRPPSARPPFRPRARAPGLLRALQPALLGARRAHLRRRAARLIAPDSVPRAGAEPAPARERGRLPLDLP